MTRGLRFHLLEIVPLVRVLYNAGEFCNDIQAGACQHLTCRLYLRRSFMFYSNIPAVKVLRDRFLEISVEISKLLGLLKPT